MVNAEVEVEERERRRGEERRRLKKGRKRSKEDKLPFPSVWPGKSVKSII